MKKPPIGEWGESEHEARLEMALARAKRNKEIRMGYGIIISAVAIALCLHWFDWKILVVIFLFLWGNNLQR